MVVDLLGHLDTSVPQAVPHVVESFTFLGVHHPIGDTVAKRVRRHIARLTTSTVEEVRLDASLIGNLRDRVADTLGFQIYKNTYANTISHNWSDSIESVNFRIISSK